MCFISICKLVLTMPYKVVSPDHSLLVLQSFPISMTILSVKSLFYIANHWYCLKAKELDLVEVYSNRSQCKVNSFHPLSLYREAYKPSQQFSRQK